MERACGLDVHKDSVFSCIINENGEIISKKFGVLTPDLEELRRHLVENHVDAAAMERKKQKMKVVVAVARKMLSAAWHILSEDTAYTDA